MSRHPFEKKAVVVTGAGSGIGAAICRRFAGPGVSVGMMDLDEAAAESVGKEVSASGAEVRVFTCDVSDRSDCEDAIGRIIHQFGGIDVLVNNAGITQRGPFTENRISVYEKVMAVNFFGSLYCTKAAIHSIMERKGSIIVMESVAGVTPLVGRTGYCASKHALHGLFTSLRCEIRKSGAHVMTVCPGFVATNLQDRALGANGGIASHSRSLVGRQTTPEQVAEAVYQGTLKRKPMLVLTPMGKVGYWISRLAPNLYERIMTQQFRDEISHLSSR